jgi:hypothetical protein
VSPIITTCPAPGCPGELAYISTVSVPNGAGREVVDIAVCEECGRLWIRKDGQWRELA